MEEENIEKRQVEVGDTAEFSKTITEYDVYTFAGCTGDFGRMHIDAEYAKNGHFGQRVAHGLIGASFPSTIMGTILPGPGTILAEYNMKFPNPVFFGDTITAHIEVTKITEKRTGYLAEFDCWCKNQKGEITTEGTAKEFMPKKNFIVKNPTVTYIPKPKGE
ncbi:MAG: MaoC family dehydratase [Clostridiales bacterium]|nr:MaoC family dehydratase [Clostridiales bacterium]